MNSATAPSVATRTAPSVDIVNEVQQTLFREARLLDEERYDEWVQMLAHDIHYYMPGMETRYRRDTVEQVHDLTTSCACTRISSPTATATSATRTRCLACAWTCGGGWTVRCAWRAAASCSNRTYC